MIKGIIYHPFHRVAVTGSRNKRFTSQATTRVIFMDAELLTTPIHHKESRNEQALGSNSRRK